jgi:3-phosphoshikimate 1-carboxyvinyltransferase
MKHIEIKPNKLSGSVNIPPSKSICHRAVICAGLSNGISHIENIVYSGDVEATIGAMENLGVDVSRNSHALEIKGAEQQIVRHTDVDCSESGSTLRFMIPIMAALGNQVTFTGKGKLVERPLQPFYNIFDAQNIGYNNENGKLPLTVNGKLKPGEYRVEGNISSQFISGLLFALPLLDGDSKIIITTALESKPYIDLTIDTLKAFSIEIENINDREFIIKGNQKYCATNYRIEGDYSQAAFWLAAGVLGSNVICEGLNMESLQGDKIILDIIKYMGGTLFAEENGHKSIPSNMHGAVIDASQCPDLVPIVAVLGALGVGTTEITNAGRLRLKESDRLTAICSELKKIGADIEEKKDGLFIKGKDHLTGGLVNSWNDHRIAMALAIASIKCTEPIIIKDADCVKKSYPDFWDDFKKLGGNIDEWHVGEQN